MPHARLSPGRLPQGGLPQGRLPHGLVPCVLAVLGFSGTASATRAVVVEAGPWVAALGRAVVAASAILLVAAVTSLVAWARRTGVRRGGARSRPAMLWRPEDRRRLLLVACAIVTVFPVLHALATAGARASEMTLLGGLLPALTALCGRWRTREQVSARVWLGAALGTGALSLFALGHGGPAFGRSFALGLLAIGAAAFGYAEGALLARRFGAATVMARAVLVGVVLDALLVLALALVVGHTRGPGYGPLSSLAAEMARSEAHVATIFGVLYLGVVSMWLAYLAWYTGLARLGVARGALLQLAQVPLGLVWSRWLLGERWGVGHLLTAAVVLVSLRIALGGGRAAPIARPALPDQDNFLRRFVARRGWTRT